MTALRSLVFETGRLLIILGSMPAIAIAAFLDPIPRAKLISVCARTVIPWLRISCNIRHQLEGTDNIPDQPSVLLVKHQSAWETFVLQTIFPAQAWVLKKELLKIPLFGWGLAISRPIAIDRKAPSNALEQVVTQGKEILAEGRWVVIFPEGTRTPYGKQGKYSAGGAKLAIKAGVPVVPVAHNAGRLWAKGAFLKYPGVINLAVGKPIATEGRSPREVTAQAEQWIEGKISAWEESLS